MWHDQTRRTPFFLAATTVLAVLLLHSNLTHGANLLGNGGFESGRTGWSGGTLVTNQSQSGSACLRVDDTRTNLNVSAVTVPIAVNNGPDGEYLIEGWVRGGVAGQSILVSIDPYDADGAWISGRNRDIPIVAGTGWTHFRRAVNALPPNCATVRIHLRPAPWTDVGHLTGTAWFDSLSFGPRAPAGAWLVPDGNLRVWRAPAEEKIRREAVLPADAPRESAISLKAARGETESFQVVLQPSVTNQLLNVAFSGLRHSETDASAAVRFSAREVAYVRVTAPTDSDSMRGWIPDPLPSLSYPLKLAAGQQQPLWFSIQVPDDTPPGAYTGQLDLSFASGTNVTIPLAVHIWDFTLPRRPTLRTAYGLDLNTIDAYHNLHGDRELRRQVLRLYLQEFAAHHISPIDPIGDDHAVVTYHDAPWGRGTPSSDPAAPASGNTVFEVVDSRTDADLSAYAADLAPISRTQSYTLSWRARTDGAHAYLVSINQYDASGAWISGRNRDFVHTGDGQWQAVSVTLGAANFSSATASLRVHLYASGWSAAGSATGRTWFDDIHLTPLAGGEDLLTDGDFEYISQDGLVARADFTRFDSAARYAFDELGLNAFRLPLPGFAGGSDDEHSVGKILWYDWGTPEYEIAFSNTLHVITDHLAQRGWMDRAYAYWFDEPAPDDYAFVNAGMDMIKRVEPRLPRLLTEHAAPELRGHVDIWTPLTSTYDASWADACRSAGDDIWWYVATGPRAPWPNNFVDHPGLEQRVLFWMAWHAGVTGSLYWNTTWWRTPNAAQDPWQDPMSYSVGTSAGTWGNGDGRLLYPPRGWTNGATLVEGPTPSQRWELIREGIEDYEYHALLQRLADQVVALSTNTTFVAASRQLLASPGDVFTDLSDFTDDPAVLHGRRMAVASEIERLVALIEELGGHITVAPLAPTSLSISVH